jgi:hypothetical protein
VAIAGQQSKLAVELTVKAFSGKLVLCGFPGINRSPDP